MGDARLRRDQDDVSQWTPDGRGLLFSRRDSPNGRRSPMRLALDGGPAVVSNLVDGDRDHIVQSPALSPDGRWLAYESNESGRLEIYVQSHPSATPRVQVSRDGGSWPTWSRRGDALYFVAANVIQSSAITTQPELRSAPPRLVVSDPMLTRPIAGARAFDVAPDGRILAIREDGSVRSDHIVVVQNWLTNARPRGVEGGPGDHSAGARPRRSAPHGFSGPGGLGAPFASTVKVRGLHLLQPLDEHHVGLPRGARDGDARAIRRQAEVLDGHVRERGERPGRAPVDGLSDEIARIVRVDGEDRASIR